MGWYSAGTLARNKHDLRADLSCPSLGWAVVHLWCESSIEVCCWLQREHRNEHPLACKVRAQKNNMLANVAWCYENTCTLLKPLHSHMMAESRHTLPETASWFVGGEEVYNSFFDNSGSVLPSNFRKESFSKDMPLAIPVPLPALPLLFPSLGEESRPAASHIHETRPLGPLTGVWSLFLSIKTLMAGFVATGTVWRFCMEPHEGQHQAQANPWLFHFAVMCEPETSPCQQRATRRQASADEAPFIRDKVPEWGPNFSLTAPLFLVLMKSNSYRRGGTFRDGYSADIFKRTGNKSLKKVEARRCHLERAKI